MADDHRRIIGGAGTLHEPWRQVGRQLRHVAAAVPILGHLLRVAKGQDGCAQVADLCSEVVEVVLARDFVAGCRQDARKQVAHERPAGIADVQRAGRVGRHELDIHSLRDGCLAAAPAFGLAQDPIDRGLEGALGEAEV